MPRPVHVHTCEPPEEWLVIGAKDKPVKVRTPDGENRETWEAHTWSCTSPYCNTLDRVCATHGGKRVRLLQED